MTAVPPAVSTPAETPILSQSGALPDRISIARGCDDYIDVIRPDSSGWAAFPQ